MTRGNHKKKISLKTYFPTIIPNFHHGNTVIVSMDTIGIIVGIRVF